MDEHKSLEQARFVSNLDALRQVSRKGIEFWYARDLQGPLGYSRWEGFVQALGRARMACESAGVNPANQFRGVTKKVAIGSGAMADREDIILSRYACYLTAMNGDPRKPEIGFAQTYFAVQARRQEIADEQGSEDKRLELRSRVRTSVKVLNAAAKQAGVQKYGLFHDAGYRGLYGLGLKEIKAKKGLIEADDLMDRAGRVELAANEFRITQTEERLRRENVKSERLAFETHARVGKEVRDAIRRIGGTMPENLTPEESIKKIEAKRKRLGKSISDPNEP